MRAAGKQKTSVFNKVRTGQLSLYSCWLKQWKWMDSPSQSVKIKNSEQVTVHSEPQLFHLIGMIGEGGRGNFLG